MWGGIEGGRERWREVNRWEEEEKERVVVCLVCVCVCVGGGGEVI
jgi:hypothetical protein